MSDNCACGRVLTQVVPQLQMQRIALQLGGELVLLFSISHVCMSRSCYALIPESVVCMHCKPWGNYQAPFSSTMAVLLPATA
jgi:hypothetical protein